MGKKNKLKKLTTFRSQITALETSVQSAQTAEIISSLNQLDFSALFTIGGSNDAQRLVYCLDAILKLPIDQSNDNLHLIQLFLKKWNEASEARQQKIDPYSMNAINTYCLNLLLVIEAKFKEKGPDAQVIMQPFLENLNNCIAACEVYLDKLLNFKHIDIYADEAFELINIRLRLFFINPTALNFPNPEKSLHDTMLELFTLVTMDERKLSILFTLAINIEIAYKNTTDKQIAGELLIILSNYQKYIENALDILSQEKFCTIEAINQQKYFSALVARIYLYRNDPVSAVIILRKAKKLLTTKGILVPTGFVQNQQNLIDPVAENQINAGLLEAFCNMNVKCLNKNIIYFMNETIQNFIAVNTLKTYEQFNFIIRYFYQKLDITNAIKQYERMLELQSQNKMQYLEDSENKRSAMQFALESTMLSVYFINQNTDAVIAMAERIFSNIDAELFTHDDEKRKHQATLNNISLYYLYSLYLEHQTSFINEIIKINGLIPTPILGLLTNIYSTARKNKHTNLDFSDIINILRHGTENSIEINPLLKQVFKDEAFAKFVECIRDSFYGNSNETADINNKDDAEIENEIIDEVDVEVHETDIDEVEIKEAAVTSSANTDVQTKVHPTKNLESEPHEGTDPEDKNKSPITPDTSNVKTEGYLQHAREESKSGYPKKYKPSQAKTKLHGSTSKIENTLNETKQSINISEDKSKKEKNYTTFYLQNFYKVRLPNTFEGIERKKLVAALEKGTFAPKVKNGNSKAGVRIKKDGVSAYVTIKGKLGDLRLEGIIEGNKILLNDEFTNHAKMHAKNRY